MKGTIKMKHIHLFQHTGGGCVLGEDCNPPGRQSPCDDSYECECGAKFVALSSPDVHFTMPQNIAAKVTPKPLEGDEANPNKKDN